MTLRGGNDCSAEPVRRIRTAGKLAFVDVRRARWKNRAGWLWLILLGPIVAGTVAALSPFAVADSAWPSRVGYLMVLAVVWLSPLLLIWQHDRD